MVYVPWILFVMAVLKQAYHCSSGLNAGVKGLFCYKKRLKNGMNPWAEPFERIFIWTSWASSDVHLKIPFSQLRWNGFKPSIKSQSLIEKKLSKWEQYEENLFSFKLPSEKFLAIGKNRTACLIKSHPVIFYWGSIRPFFIEWSVNEMFFQFWWKDATQWWGLEQKKAA